MSCTIDDLLRPNLSLATRVMVFVPSESRSCSANLLLVSRKIFWPFNFTSVAFVILPLISTRGFVSRDMFFGESIEMLGPVKSPRLWNIEKLMIPRKSMHMADLFRIVENDVPSILFSGYPSQTPGCHC